MNLNPEYKWGTCGVDLSWSASRNQHIVRRGGLDTLCGNSATHSEIWRADKRKPHCEECIKAGNRIGIVTLDD